ncbi:aromatic-ring-hydroxylating dioxygenase subunit beta [Marinibaculum pumilum]|uniref:Aromatic-ring-hydroxylating dioxygenase subunit beta n=1 Tax=Marinibaculum pumilum TaxID=1766165 RepID=A0ABV7L1P8_9PROT
MGEVNRIEVEDFLFYEAELLDDWRLKDWLALFTDDAHYYVPATDLPPDASPDTNLFYIADDRFRLGERVERLLKKSAHAEYPRSKTRHLVSNVRIRERKGDEMEVGAAFATYRSRNEVTDVYVGSIRYRIVANGSGLKIREKRCELDMNGLKPQGRISIIL